MSRKLKTSSTQIADLPQVRLLSTEELEQINGGSKTGVVEVLMAMGYTYKDNLYMDKNGMPFWRRVWTPPKA